MLLAIPTQVNRPRWSMRVSGALTTAPKALLARVSEVTDNNIGKRMTVITPPYLNRPLTLFGDPASWPHDVPSHPISLRAGVARHPRFRSFSVPRADSSSNLTRRPHLLGAPPWKAAKARFILFSLKPHFAAAALSSGLLFWPAIDFFVFQLSRPPTAKPPQLRSSTVVVACPAL